MTHSKKLFNKILSNSNVPSKPTPIRLLVVPDKYAPDECGGGGIYTDMCRFMASRGIDVTVRCPIPFYPEWTDKSGKNGLGIDRYEELGVHIERYGFVIPRNPKSLFQRMLVDLSFCLSLTRSLFHGKFDAVMAFCPHSGGLVHSMMVSRLQRVPLWLNVQDIPAEAAQASGMNRNALFGKVLNEIQNFLFNRGDLWSTISPVMVDRLVRIRNRNQPIIFLPNWLHGSVSELIGRLPSKFGRSLSDPIRLFYSGNIGSKQGLLEFCQFLAESKCPFRFRIHGDGGAASELRDWITSRDDNRFSFGPLIDEPGFILALHEADLFVITEKSGSGASFFPSKAIPSLASGTPILAISDPDSPLGTEMRSKNIGPWFSWDQCSKVGSFLVNLHSSQHEFMSWQKNCLFRSRFYHREYCMEFIETNLRNLVCKKDPVKLFSSSRNDSHVEAEGLSSPIPNSLTLPDCRV